jgi:hypothetical protein
MHWTLQEASTWLAKPHIANAFGFILYTDRHANVAKVLADDDYWRGLSERTGERWPIFALRRPPGTSERPQPVPGRLPILQEIWKEPAENKMLLAELGLDSTKKPYLAICSLVDEAQMLVHTIELSDDSVEAAHASLREALDAVTLAVDDVSPRNIKSAEGVHAAIDLTVTDLKQRKWIKKVLPLLKVFKSIFGGHPST